MTPTVDSLIENHGQIYSPPQLDVNELPKGAQWLNFRVDDELVDLSVTQLNIPGQTTGFVYCGGNSFRQGLGGRAVLTAFEPSQSSLIFDYPGYGNSGGDTTATHFERATVVMAQQVADWRQRHGFESILFWGRSFGGTICARIAGLYHGDSRLVLETTYNDLHSLAAARAGIFRRLVRVEFEPGAPDLHIDQSLRNYQGPVAVLMSEDDGITPAGESQNLVRLLTTQGVRAQLVNLGNFGHRSLLSDPCAAQRHLPEMDAVMQGLRTQPCPRDGDAAMPADPQ